MGLIDSLHSPADLRSLSEEQLEALCAEIRGFLVEKVSATGGHLGPNLGVVELTVAIHRVFDSPQDPIVFDTSHQSYVHKIVTGRANQFDTLRQKDGLSGYTDRGESPHDWTESSHASAALSVADGLAKAFALQGENDRHVVAVVGDGALTGGMCWEALNNIAADKTRNVVIVVNDNGRSYSPTIGGLAENLAQLRMQPFYDKVMESGKTTLNSMGWVGKRTFEKLRTVKEGIRHTVIPEEMFPELGMKYIGPVDGHNLQDLTGALKYARSYRGPIIVHAVTQKGRGYAPAENNAADLMHSTGIIDPETGEPRAASKPGWTKVFSDTLLEIGESRDDVVAITAAMAGPTGLAPFGERFPDRLFDVGIAEQHAMTSAAGLALGGMHPVVAIYSTFLNRAFDQLLMDVALTKLPVTIVLDRAGVTGSDGPSHNGVWDMAISGIVPGIRVNAPRDADELRAALQQAVTITDGPTVIRFPKGSLPQPLPALIRLHDGLDVLHYDDAAAVDALAGGASPISSTSITAPVGDTTPGQPALSADDTPSVLVVAIGTFAHRCMQAAELLREQSIAVTVVDPRWAIPVPPSIVALAADHDLVVTVEDGVIHGSVGSMIGQVLRAAEVDTPLRHVAVPEQFLRHASRNQVLTELGITPAALAESISGWISTIVSDDEPQQQDLEPND
ncbi:1-deoxy-D-xylulose-5-phosphate synthase [Corynebacterium choanae]|uniref:1-deoxy-D-xylulose-5-phosphate synthase n=1 Tax=Corynebacterium choanae TaxID=1862358 RepID=A0A3G6J6J5_9CORY|nr:1-deoxy-D-xylulose-5-phosphate synthase [Corynebacterium choanae]AZA13725.1 1-deoxy-D-xylulose-5-phosphate synthase [Corynebacterium choanae]